MVTSYVKGKKKTKEQETDMYACGEQILTINRIVNNSNKLLTINRIVSCALVLNYFIILNLSQYCETQKC